MLDVSVKLLLADEEDLSRVVGPLREWLLAQQPNIVSGQHGTLGITMSVICDLFLEMHVALRHDRRLGGSRKNLVILGTEGIHGINVIVPILEATVDSLPWILDACLKTHQWLKNKQHTGGNHYRLMLA